MISLWYPAAPRSMRQTREASAIHCTPTITRCVKANVRLYSGATSNSLECLLDLEGCDSTRLPTPPSHRSGFRSFTSASVMDSATVRELEAIRKRTPRYLFRGWCNDESRGGRLSGGYKGLNTTEGITPLAFHLGRGRRSVYDLTEEEFTDMVLSHLSGGCQPETMLSSWAASLSVSMDNYAGEGAHISIIDTRLLWKSNEIFFVPSLNFLDPERIPEYTEEYLAFGVIRWVAHKAIPLSTFYSLGYQYPFQYIYDDCDVYDGHAEDSQYDIVPPARVDAPPAPAINKSAQIARQIGEKYGGSFTLPMTLALLCRDDQFEFTIPFPEGGVELQMFKDAVLGLFIPEDWSTDDTIMKDIVFTSGYRDLELMIKLMRTLVKAKEMEMDNKEAVKMKVAKKDWAKNQAPGPAAGVRNHATTSPHSSPGLSIMLREESSSKVQRIEDAESGSPTPGRRKVGLGGTLVREQDEEEVWNKEPELDPLEIEINR